MADPVTITRSQLRQAEADAWAAGYAAALEDVERVQHGDYACSVNPHRDTP